MASIFDAYAQAYDKSLRTENAMAENLRRAYLDRQTMDINQANAARQAQRFNFELQNLEAETPNKVAQANIMNSIFKDPAFVDAVRTGKISGAQVTALMNNASLTGLQGMGNDLPTALSAGLFQNLNAANNSQRQIALGGNDPAEVARLFGVKNPRKENGFWLDDAGKKIYSSPAAGVQANMWEDYMNKLRGDTTGKSATSVTADTTPMASMTSGQNMSMAPGFGPINPLAGTKPIQPITPIMPTPAVSAQPAFPAVGGQTAAPIQNLGGGLTYDPNARARLIQPLTNFWNGVTGGLSTGMDFLGGAASAVSPAPAVSPDFYDWLEQRPKFQYGIQPNLNFPNAPNKWLNQGR